MVTLKQLQKARLRPRRPLDASEPNVRIRPLDIPQIPEQLLDPEGRSLADGDELGRLEVRPPECGEGAVLLGPGGESVDDDGELGEEELKAPAEEDEVGVARNCRKGS